MNEPTKHPYFGVPPTRAPQPASNVKTIRGKRVILSTPEGFVYDMRAVSECQVGVDDSEFVDIVSEEDYYRWMLTRHRTAPESWAVGLIWIE